MSGVGGFQWFPVQCGVPAGRRHEPGGARRGDTLSGERATDGCLARLLSSGPDDETVCVQMIPAYEAECVKEAQVRAVTLPPDWSVGLLLEELREAMMEVRPAVLKTAASLRHSGLYDSDPRTRTRTRITIETVPVASRWRSD